MSDYIQTEAALVPNTANLVHDHAHEDEEEIAAEVEIAVTAKMTEKDLVLVTKKRTNAMPALSNRTRKTTELVHPLKRSLARLKLKARMETKTRGLQCSELLNLVTSP
jgi:hypothetical protein